MKNDLMKFIAESKKERDKVAQTAEEYPHGRPEVSIDVFLPAQFQNISIEGSISL